MQAEMTIRDHFAAAALTGLLANGDYSMESTPGLALGLADAMLRERERTNHDAAPAARASLPTADHAVCRGRESGCGTGVTPAIDRLREWERHGSGRWGLGAAGDVTMLERRLAMVEAIVHDAAPAARAQTDADRVRTDKAVSRPGACTGDTQEPLAWAVASGSRRVYDVYDNEGEAVAICLWLRDEENDGSWVAVPLYRSPTLTDAEREAVECASIWVNPERQATLRGLLERLGGAK